MKRIIKMYSSDNENIRFPYLLIVPENMPPNASLIVDIQTPLAQKGDVDTMIEQLDKRNSSVIAEYLQRFTHYPILIPLIPRPEGFYTSYLGNSVINNDFSNLHGNIPPQDEYRFESIDMQVYNMIKEANQTLGLNSKAIINGYSASSKFATGFSVLHPDVICCNISGGTSGLTTLPIDSIDGIDLPYPLGTGDIKFDEENFKRIKHFFYIGENDNNNPALPLCELSDKRDVNGNPLPQINKNGTINFERDEDGMLMPFYPECYSPLEINIIDRIHGHDNQKRFRFIQEKYRELGIESEHLVIRGANHKNIFNSPDLRGRLEIVKMIYSILKELRKIKALEATLPDELVAQNDIPKSLKLKSSSNSNGGFTTQFVLFTILSAILTTLVIVALFTIYNFISR